MKYHLSVNDQICTIIEVHLVVEPIASIPSLSSSSKGRPSFNPLMEGTGSSTGSILYKSLKRR